MHKYKVSLVPNPVMLRTVCADSPASAIRKAFGMTMCQELNEFVSRMGTKITIFSRNSVSIYVETVKAWF